MKKGDKLYCKKTLIHYNKKFFIKGKIYIVEEICDDIIYIFDEFKNSSFHINEPNVDQYKLERYFYTNKEYRKIKIKKINESNLH